MICMHKSVYKHISGYEFYVTFNVIRLYFIEDYDIKTRGIKNKKIGNNFRNDKFRRVYERISLNIPTIQRAIYLILSNFLENKECCITEFKLESPYYNLFLRYSNNEYAIIDDFSELCNTVEIFNKIKTGELIDDVINKKYNFVLLLFVNEVIPIIKLSLENIKKPQKEFELFYGDTTSCSNITDVPDDYMYKKPQIFIHINKEKKEFLSTRIQNILLNNKPVTI